MPDRSIPLAPGVYVKDAPSGIRTISGAGTSTAAFLGYAGPLPHALQPVLVRSWSEFSMVNTASKAASALAGEGHLADAVRGYFSNGGISCYVLPLDPALPPLEALAGDAEAGSGLAGLEKLSDVSIVAVPDLWSMAEKADAAALMNAVVEHCALMRNRVAVLDAPPGIAPDDLVDHLPTLDGDASFAALYYPWIKVSGLAGAERTVPPCGHIAGAWARTDAERGVHKAPANMPLTDTTGLAHAATDEQQAHLNDRGVNCLRTFPSRGVLIWGARTLAGPSDHDYRYLNVRRLVCFLEESIKQSTTWAVFEPNDESLRATLRQAVTAFLTDHWREGALAGTTPDDAFRVICDQTNNPQEIIDQGKVNCDIHIAPARPAEFIHFTVQQAAASKA
ncbi:phage tail sheath family protein [Streptomyces aureoverticillatus]|nr:phage tail sheath family protein [Streptomyces aureoverticillatus]